MLAEPQVVFLRGINVGGRNILPMADLRDVLSGLGLADVKTHIQSGNAVFRGPLDADLPGRLGAAIKTRFGFEPMVLVLRAAMLAKIQAENPFFAEGEKDGASVSIGFLAEPSGADLAALADLAAPNERFHLTNAAFYVHAPSGIGRSKLATRAEKLLAVPMTMRNQRVVAAVTALAQTLREG